MTTKTMSIVYGRCAIAVAVALLIDFRPARAHDTVDHQTESLTRLISERPDDAELYLRRGELHRLGQEWAAAQADYNMAAALDPTRVETDLYRGALWLDLGDAPTAVRALDMFLSNRPNHPEGLLLRSRALRACGRADAAITDMDRAIALLPNPRPDHYLERAHILANEKDADLDAALRGLDEGILRLGPLVSLELVAIDLEIAAGRPSAALLRLARVEAQTGPQATKRTQIFSAARAQGLDLDAHAGAVTVAQSAVFPTFPNPLSPAAIAPQRPRLPDSRVALISVTRGPYLQVVTPTSAVVRWRTDALSDSRVNHGSSPSSLSSTVNNPALVTDHEVTLSNLTPDTRYYYEISSNGESLAGGDADHFVTTAPVPGQAKPTRIWVLGDSGEPGAEQLAVRDAYTAFTGPRTTDVWLMLGDNAYSAGTDLDYQEGLFDPYKEQLRNAPLWPTRGNHDDVFEGDNNDYYDFFTMPTAGQAGGVASGTEAYYSFDHGNIHFVCLDSDGSNPLPTGSMAIWLRADLAANDSDWTIAFWHHPPYSKGSHDSDSSGDMRDMRTYILPILDSLGVDLVLTGHSHSYERSFLLDRHYSTSPTLDGSMILDALSGNPNTDGPYVKATLGSAANEGAVYAVAGSSAKISGGPLNHPAMFASMNILGSMVLDVDGPRLHARFVDDNGAVRDYFAIVKGSIGGTTDTETPARVDFRLDSGRPNPFRGQTSITYSVPTLGTVRLTVHDAAGRRVATIVNGQRSAGEHVATWNGRNHSGQPVAAGVYFARIEFGGESRLGKIVLSH